MNYVCGDCGRSRPESDITLVEHKNDRLGEFPICNDSPCHIESVSDFTVDSNPYRVTDTLE